MVRPPAPANPANGWTAGSSASAAKSRPRLDSEMSLPISQIIFVLYLNLNRFYYDITMFTD
jgi:hypothetical protein